MISDATPLEQAETVSSPTASTTLSGKREALLDFVMVGLACLVFLAFSLYQLDLPGLYTDEAYDVIPAMQMVLGHHVELQGDVLDLGGLRLPLMSSSAYQGVTYTYLALPFFALGGVNVISLRMMTVLVGVLGVILAYFLGRAWFGRGVGRMSALLLAISPAWIFWSRLGVYVVSVVVPIATGALLAFTSWVRSHPKGGHGRLYLGMFLLGLGLSTKLLFLWFISAVILTSLILWGRLLWKHLRLIRESIGTRARVVFFSLLAFSLGALPFILYNILTRGTINLLRQTLSGPGTTSHGVDNSAVIRNLWTEVDAFKVLLDGGYFWFQGVNQQPHANPVTPAIFAIAALGLIALVLARRVPAMGQRIPNNSFRLAAILLTGAFAIAFLQVITGANDTIGTLLALASIILSLSGIVILMLVALRRDDATAPAGWVLLAITTIAGAVWWFGGAGRPEGHAPGAFLGLWSIDAAGIIFLLSGAGLLVILGADKHPVRPERAMVAALSLIGLLVVQSTVTVSGLWSTHLLIVLPLPQVVIAAFAVELTRSIRDWLAEKRRGNSWAWLRLVPAILLVGAIVVGDAAVDGIYHHDLALMGGASTFSDAIYSLDRYLQTDKAGYKVVAMDWGFRRPLQLLSNEQVMPIEGYGLSEEPPPEFYTSLREFIQDEKTVYLFHTDQGTAYHRREAFLQEVANAGKEAVQDATFKHRDGIPVYELYTVR
ncbi:MAG TPA: glycosyltransferase family 39 protein [Chloroflexia bacterium]|nr:glycosyltransferase family 39 protein [Chloroflexia bacterium]